MPSPAHQDEQDRELELERETVKDLDVDEDAAAMVDGGNSAGVTRPGTTHVAEL